MSRNLDYKNLSPIERRVAHMHVAELSQRDISIFVDVDQATVGNILLRPHVAKYVVALHATVASELAPSYKDLSVAIDNAADRAFEIENSVMEKLYSTPEDSKQYVRALIGSAATAQDILDRAGKRAPTKVTHTFEVDKDSIDRIADVMREDDRIKRAHDVTPRQNGGEDGRGGAASISMPLSVGNGTNG